MSLVFINVRGVDKRSIKYSKIEALRKLIAMESIIFYPFPMFGILVSYSLIYDIYYILWICDETNFFSLRPFFHCDDFENIHKRIPSAQPSPVGKDKSSIQKG